MSKIATAAIESLRDRGYAVVVFSPEDLQSISPEALEERMRETASIMLMSSDTLTYLVTHYCETEDENQQYECDATDINHAIEQFEAQYPEHTISSVELQ